MSYHFAIDDNGAPLLMEAAVVESKPQPEPAEGSEARRRDAVVDAARTVEDLSPEGVEQFVRRRWRGDRVVSSEDFEAFSAAAREQRVHDVADALDHRIRRAVYGRAGAKHAHVSIPRGIIGKSLAQLEPEEMKDVLARLRERGWSKEQIIRHGVRRFDKDNAMREQLEQD